MVVSTPKNLFTSLFSNNKTTAHKPIESSTYLHKHIPGLYIFPSAISPHLESHLLTLLDADSDRVPWVDRKSRITKNYGPHYRYIEWESEEGRMRQCDGVVYYEELPAWVHGELMPILRKLGCDDGSGSGGVGGGGLLEEFEPNQVHVAKYERSCGHRIGMHNDNRMGVLGEFIVGVCLGARCEMVWMEGDEGKKRSVGLERRCVYVMSGKCHREWKHGILGKSVEGVRVSITLRELKAVKIEEGVRLVPKKKKGKGRRV